jgi:hypothetical protein
MRRAFNITFDFEFYVIRGRPFPQFITLALRRRLLWRWQPDLFFTLSFIYLPTGGIHKSIFSTSDPVH